MSMTKTLIASVLAFASASTAFAGGLNETIVEAPPVVEEVTGSSFSGPTSFGGAGGVVVGVVGLALVAALVSDSDGSSSTTTTD